MEAEPDEFFIYDKKESVLSSSVRFFLFLVFFFFGGGEPNSLGLTSWLSSFLFSSSFLTIHRPNF